MADDLIAPLENQIRPWIEAALPSGSGNLKIRQIEGGASNLTYKVEWNEQRLFLRHPPAVSNDPSANNMSRELKLLRALGRSDVPHARLVAGCDDATVIGVPFALMEWIDGVPGKDPLPSDFDGDPHARRHMAYALVDALATISTVDWRAVGLEGFGKPDNFLQRQVDRWLGQLGHYRTRDIPHLDAVAEWLRTHQPVTQRAALIHGDYQFINVMFACDNPVRIAAVVDWESATIGDPLLDLGWMLGLWHEQGETPVHSPYFDYTGVPTRAEMAARYAKATGLDVSHLDFYMVLALFKLGIIMEGWYAKFLEGDTNHPAHRDAREDVPRMIARAAHFAGLKKGE